MIDLPPERTGHAAPLALAERRALMRGLGHSLAEEVIAGVRCLIANPDGPATGTILHFHGGGYRLGAPELDAAYARLIAQRVGLRVIMPAYRLAPEHPFPAALHDGWNVLAETHPTFLSGASAGGGLAAALATAQGTALNGLILHSPWLDLTLSADSWHRNAATDALFSLEAAKEAAALYLQGEAATHPLASPLFGPLTALQPSFISCGTGEVLTDDSQHFHTALRAAGIASTFVLEPNMDHIAPVRDPACDAARSVLNNLLNWLTTIGLETRPPPR